MADFAVTFVTSFLVGYGAVRLFHDLRALVALHKGDPG